MTTSVLETAMPVVMAGHYVPEACKTFASRQQFIAKHLPHSRFLTLFGDLPPNTKILSCKDTQNRLWFYSVYSGDLAYVMHLNPIRYTDRSGTLPTSLSMYQGSVWRSRRTGQGLPRLPQKIFWALFAKGRRIWFSDSVQSEDGKAFWENRILDAFNKNLTVLACHFKDGSPMIIDRTEPVDINTDIQKYWTYEVDRDDSGMNWRFAIF